MPSLFSQELRWLIPHLKPHLRLHVQSFLALTLATLLSLGTPLAIRWLIDQVLPAHDLVLLALAIIVIFASCQARAVLVAVGAYLTFLATQAAALGLRMSLLQHLDSLSSEYFDRTPVGELQYPLEAPIDEISYFGADLVPSILRAAIATGVTLSAMMLLNRRLTLVVIPVIPLFLVLRQRFRKKIGQEADLVQAAGSQFSSFLAEHLAALTEIQLLGQTGQQEQEAAGLLSKSVRAQEALAKTGVWFSVLSNLAIVTGIAATLACGSVMVFRRALTIGTLVAFHSLLLELFDPLTTAMEMYARAQRAFSSIRRIQAVLEIRPAVRDRPCAKALASHVSLQLDFRNVSFAYRRHGNVVRIPSLDIRDGQRVAVVGPNGAGKSTLGKLLARLYDVESGEIRVARVDLRDVRLHNLRAAICYLPAQPVLFHRSLADNLRIGRSEATASEMEQVLRMVRLTKHLDGYPTSLDEVIEPNGRNLSSGERQRLAIARSILQRPRILILDETTCSLDPASEETILRTIEQALPDSTLIAITHRLQSISWMGRILVMWRGEIVGDGNHETLLRTNPHYQELVRSPVSAD
jgi:ABC-type multidrug transport system fused ATPase/permease subunit